MIVSKTVKIKWNSKNKKHYVGLGYKYTKMRDEFEVSVNDLTLSSDAMINVQCDYCKELYQKHWHNFIAENKNSFVHKDCCSKCKKYKIQEVAELKYGVKSVLSLEETKEKVETTNIEKYGCRNPFGNEEIKEKIANTNMQKYGTKSPIQNVEVKEKSRQTCLRKYGVESYILTQIKYGKENPRWKGGVEYHRNERATHEYCNWRKQVFSRDSYTCQCCGDKSRKGHSVRLEAHHIYNWNDNKDIRYDISNGITLCQDCHIVFHMIYGKKENTDLQIKSFLDEYGKKVC